MQDLSEMIKGFQGFGPTGLEEILNTKTISTVNAIKFHPGFY
jgi:hypothetical protein